MKRFYLICFFSISLMSKAQKIFSYTHYTTPCQLLIHSDSTTIRIQQDKDHGLYIESRGRIKKTGNSLYQIVDTANFSMSLEENDTNAYSQFWILVDSSFKYFSDIKNLKLIYFNGATRIVNPIKGKFIDYYFDKSKFNQQHPHLTIVTNHLHPITRKSVYLKLFLRASITFDSKYIESFQLFMSPKDIHMIGESIIREINASNAN